MMTKDIKARDGWCILRTSGQKTLPLVRSLRSAGFDVWTPVRTLKRPAPGHRRRLHLGLRKVMVEVDTAIVPSIVFARAHHLDDLARAAADPFSQHPAFSIFHWGSRVPLIDDSQIAGLRAAEDEATAAINVERDAESKKAAREERASRLGSERARRKALRQERKTFEPGVDVTIDDMPALAGMVGQVVRGQGASAQIRFGGVLTMTVEAWRVRPIHDTLSALAG
jgi:hypothetical protein